MDDLLGSLRKMAQEERLNGDAGSSSLSAQDREAIAQALLGGAPAATRQAKARPPWLLAARRWSVVVLPLAAAASLFLFLHGGPQVGGAGESLPVYGLSVQGGVKEVRGGGDRPGAEEPARPAISLQRVAPGSELVLLARPDEAVTGPVTARVFLGGAGPTRELSTDVSLSPSGSLSIRVTPWAAGEREVPIASNTSATLWTAVGRPDALSSFSAATLPLPPVDTSSVRWLAVPVVRLAP